MRRAERGRARALNTGVQAARGEIILTTDLSCRAEPHWIRTVVDTNIVVSAFLWGGTPRAILDAARRKGITLFTSAALIAELEDVLSREKFAERIAEVGSSADEMLGDYLALATLVRPTEKPAIVRDPDDDQIHLGGG